MNIAHKEKTYFAWLLITVTANYTIYWWLARLATFRKESTETNLIWKLSYRKTELLYEFYIHNTFRTALSHHCPFRNNCSWKSKRFGKLFSCVTQRSVLDVICFQHSKLHVTLQMQHIPHPTTNSYSQHNDNK